MQIIFLSSRIHIHSYCHKQCYPTILNLHKISPLYLRLRNTSLSHYTSIYLQMACGTSSNMAALLNSTKDMDAAMYNLASFYQNVSVSVYTNIASSRSNISYNIKTQFNTLSTFWRYEFNTTNNLNRTTIYHSCTHKTCLPPVLSEHKFAKERWDFGYFRKAYEKLVVTWSGLTQIGW